MKRLLAAILVLTLLCGCAEETVDRTVYQPTDATEIISDVEKPNDTIAPQTFCLSYFPDAGFHPYSSASLTNRTFFSLLYEGLFVVNAQLTPEPVLCDTFSASEDRKTYTFTLLPDVLFTDGTPLRASDVAASLLSAKSSAYYAGRLRHMVSVQAMDERTVQVTLSIPYENLPLVLDVPILKEASISHSIPIGTGSYALTALPAGGYCLTRSDYYTHAEPILQLTTISLKAADSSTAVRDSFEFGETNLVCTDPNSTGSAGYHCNYEVWDCSTSVMQYLGFNSNRALFSSWRLRQAVTYAIDRQAITTDIMDGYAEPASLPCSPLSPYYDASLAKDYLQNVPLFQSALNSAGVGGNKDDPGILIVCANSSARVEAAQAVADMLAACGLYLQVQTLDYDSYLSALQNGDYDMYYAETRLSANFDLTEFFAEDGSLNYGNLTSEETVALCQEAIQNSGGYRELFQKVMDEGFICPILFKNNAIFMTRGYLRDLTPAVDTVFYHSTGRTLSDCVA